ncbi:hypothetical protein OG978_10020 [Streptomyces sp. NBC_01591]|uniref:hypothetical protein n=1 Tax=Streptomyces sp. NBC_01591 TaxID=2975888 RepID=UPI002DDAE7A5|nr:hypothetical protein [Streptomyces sp. NBC_01591]WSD67690.1 hypothetical protein OG978_10020 [Streptomyces sp. NBC_01591]
MKLELFSDERSGRYDFTEVTALLDLVLRIVVPTAEPYATALATFEGQARGIVDTTNGYDGATEQVRRLFAELVTVLDRWEDDRPGNPLITGLRPIFLGTAERPGPWARRIPPALAEVTKDC